MKSETLIEMMLSGQYNTLTVSEFGAICRETIKAEEAKFSDDVQLGAMAEDEKYAKQVERANDILAEYDMDEKGKYFETT